MSAGKQTPLPGLGGGSPCRGDAQALMLLPGSLARAQEVSVGKGTPVTENGERREGSWGTGGAVSSGCGRPGRLFLFETGWM